MKLPTERYVDQVPHWPPTGRHILAHFDEETIVVYQAYSPSIGLPAAAHGSFGPGFSYSRMSWVKPNFLWMMYRSDWGRAPGQEVVLALRLRRAFFDALLASAVPSSFDGTLYCAHETWQASVAHSDVRLQWDPDHLPSGAACARRAIQLGLRGRALAAYGKSEIVDVIDVSDFVAEQRDNAVAGAPNLRTPVERTYLPRDSGIRSRIGLAPEAGPRP
jgi:hypothetical protein